MTVSTQYLGESYKVTRVRGRRTGQLGYRIVSPRGSYTYLDGGVCSCPAYRFKGRCRHGEIAVMVRECLAWKRQGGVG